LSCFSVSDVTFLVGTCLQTGAASEYSDEEESDNEDDSEEEGNDDEMPASKKDKKATPKKDGADGVTEGVSKMAVGSFFLLHGHEASFHGQALY
jgi:hypothetical protein